MKGIKIDYIGKKIILTKAFVKAMDDFNSDEYKTYCSVTTQFPQFEVLGRTHKSPNKPNRNKNLTYKNMERYIKANDNSAECLEAFQKVKEAAATQPSCYQFVREWFVKQYPEYREVTQYICDRHKVISLPIDRNNEKNA